MLAGEYSINAKLLYGLPLNRTTLSQKSGWVSEDGNVYVIYTIKQMADDLDQSERTVKTALRELHLSANPGRGAVFFPSRGQYLPNGCAGFFPLHRAKIAYK